MPDFILAMEEAQKKAKHAELSILNIKLTMYATTSVLQLGNYKKETDKWEGHSAAIKTWSKRKQTYLAAYARGVNRQRAGATDKPCSRAANLVTLPAAHDVMDALAGSLDNLARATTTNRTTVQQLTSANLSLTTLVATLMGANKKLTNTVARYNPRLRDTAVAEDVGVTAPVVAPQQFGATTAGCMGIRYCIPVKPEM
jgi:hypothetical protein